MAQIAPPAGLQIDLVHQCRKLDWQTSVVAVGFCLRWAPAKKMLSPRKIWSDMVQKLPLTDFRAIRGKLEPHMFAISEGQDVPPSDLVDHAVWDGIMHLPEDVSVRVSDHNRLRVRLLYQLWGDWIKAIGEPDKRDEMFDCLLEAADCFQGATFNFLHGYYRTSLVELRTALELVMIGAFGNLYPADKDYCEWKAGRSEFFGFTRCRKRLLGKLKKEQGKWMFEENGPLRSVYRSLSNYTHARPDAGYGVLWESNGPV